jgi:hypothetical protein
MQEYDEFNLNTNPTKKYRTIHSIMPYDVQTYVLYYQQQC